MDNPSSFARNLYNPEAGLHPMLSDPVEIQAISAAAKASWEKFPYYAMRYGARGEAFTRSDSGFVATLLNSGEAELRQHVYWLGRVLASRGMPRWLLEEHLGLMFRELIRYNPEKRSRYLKLEKAHGLLRQARLSRISLDRFQVLGDSFQQWVGSEIGHFREAGLLIVAAVADEKDGIARAVPSLVNWLASPARFSLRWRAAVHTIVTQSRADTDR